MNARAAANRRGYSYFDAEGKRDVPVASVYDPAQRANTVKSMSRTSDYLTFDPSQASRNAF